VGKGRAWTSMNLSEMYLVSDSEHISKSACVHIDKCGSDLETMFEMRWICRWRKIYLLHANFKWIRLAVNKFVDRNFDSERKKKIILTLSLRLNLTSYYPRHVAYIITFVTHIEFACKSDSSMDVDNMRVGLLSWSSCFAGIKWQAVDRCAFCYFVPSCRC